MAAEQGISGTEPGLADDDEKRLARRQQVTGCGRWSTLTEPKRVNSLAYVYLNFLKSVN